MVERGLDGAREDEEPEAAMTKEKESDLIKNHRKKKKKKKKKRGKISRKTEEETKEHMQENRAVKKTIHRNGELAKEVYSSETILRLGLRL